MTIAAGAPILASDINNLLIRKYKAADETVSNSTTLQDDDDLFFTASANEVWGFQFNLLYSGTTTGDFKMALTFPTGAIVPWGRMGQDTSLAISNIGFDNPTSGTSNFAQGGNGASNTLVALIVGTAILSSTGGNVRLQFAMNTTDSGQVARLRRGSNMLAWKIA